MKRKVLLASRILLSIVAFAAAGSRTEGLSLMVQQISSVGARQWLGLMVGSIVASSPVIAPLSDRIALSLTYRTGPQSLRAEPTIPREPTAQRSGLNQWSEAMCNILYVSSSPRGSASYSNRVAARVIDELRRANPQSTLTVRELAQEPLPHIDADFVAATRNAGGPSTDKQRAILTKSDALVDELLAADIVVIAAPMINFSVSTTLKSWFDYVARAGRTFSYSETGPKGLVTGKRVIVVSASGGIYSGGNAAFDFQVPWLRNMLGFLGMTDVDVIRIEGTALGPEAADKALDRAAAHARDFVGALAAA